MKVLTLQENVMCTKRQCLSYLSCLVPLRRVYSETMTCTTGISHSHNTTRYDIMQNIMYHMVLTTLSGVLGHIQKLHFF